MKIHEKLNQLAEYYNVDDKDIAEILGMSKAGYSKLKNQGKRLNLEYVILLCDHFKISPYFFIKDDYEITRKDTDRLSKEELRLISDYRQIGDHDRLEIKTLLNLKISRIENFEKK